jgi:hypothetical protein
MANEIKLELYTFRIREKRSDDFLNLDSFFGESDFFAFFQEYISTLDQELLVNESQKKSLQFVSDNISIAFENRTISGVVESGDYGVESRIVDRTSKKENYRKMVDDLDIKPFYFLILAPKRHNKGLLVLQRLGGFGINALFTYHFEKYFKMKYEGLLVEFNPFVSKELAKAFIENGAIKEISLKRYSLPSDLIDKLGLTNHREDVLSIELRITAKQKRFLPFNGRVDKFIKNPNARLFEIGELEKLGFDGTHKSSIKVKVGTNTRTVDLSETGQIRPYYDINNEVEKELSGHPKFASIDKIAKGLVADLMTEFNV